jgi:hypothetical protein
MDLTIPYTFYPSSLPHWLAWNLFGAALLGALTASVVVARVKRLWVSVLVFFPILLGLLVVTIIASMALTFFIHDF